jgi:uncharacterized membrane protein YhaH (DUF805 family)
MTIGEIGGAVRRGLTSVTIFGGRDSRAQFWPYIIFVYLIEYAIEMMLTMPVVMRGVFSSMQGVRAAAEQGGKVDSAALQVDMAQRMMADMQSIMPYTIGLGLLLMVLVSAAVVRRLHDRNWSGWWVLAWNGVKIAGIVAGYLSMTAMAQGGVTIETMNSVKLPAMLIGLASWAVFIIIIIQVVQQGDHAENRFGPSPQEDIFA